MSRKWRASRLIAPVGREEAEKIAADPKAGEFLPQFGYALKDAHTYGQVESFRAWQMEEHIHMTFRRDLEQEVRQLVVNDSQPDGSLLQRLDGRALADAWINCTASVYRLREHLRVSVNIALDYWSDGHPLRRLHP